MTTDLLNEILTTCERVAKRGELYRVHRFRYIASAQRKACGKLVAAGRLVRAGRDNPWLFFYRPEDLPVIEAANARHQQEMKKVYAKNVQWHLDQAEKCPALRDYHLKQADSERELAA